MSSIALFIIHQTKPGKREEVKTIWLKYMAPAVQNNAKHLAYFYTFKNDNPDSICAFQQYESAQAAQDFLKHPNYQMYLEETENLLEKPPEIMFLDPQWIKSF